MGGVVEAIGDAVGGVVKDVFGGVGDVLDFVGLDSLGKEVTRWGEDVEQVVKVLSGEYHDDVKKVKEYEKTVSNKKAELVIELIKLVAIPAKAILILTKPTIS